MKSLLIASLLVASSSLFAMPKIGDMAAYSGSVAGMNMTVKSELTAFDSQKSTFTKVSTTTFMGQASTESEELTSEDLLSEETISAMMEYCETSYINGKRETVAVPAGTFDTCAITSQDGSIINIGMVPFGIVKMSNNNVTLSLTEYKIAQ